MTAYLQILIFGLCLGGVYALMASGLTLIFGVMRIVNLAHPIFIIGAAYISYYLFTGLKLDPLLSLPINMVVMFGVGVLVYKLVFARDADNPRYSEMTVLLTFAVAMIFDGLLGYFFTNTQRVTSPAYATQAFFMGDLFIPKAQLYAGVLSLVLVGALWAFLQYTPLGYAIRATTQNRAAASAGRQRGASLHDHLWHWHGAGRRIRRANELSL
ncbi:MAG: branched-chain amino acid ABC transporter permease [Caldilineaceae bacterium]